MKKPVVIFVVLFFCLAGWAGATYVIGDKMEKEYSSFVKQYAEWGIFSLSSQSYQRGFLSSKAITVLELKISNEGIEGAGQPAEKSLRMVFEHSLSHGPKLFTVRSGDLALVKTRLIGLSPGGEELEALLATVPELQEPFAMTRFGFDGTATTHIVIPPFETARDDGKVSWGGFNAEMVFSPGTKRWIGSFEMPKMEAASSGGLMVLDNFHGRLDVVESLPGLYAGVSEVGLNSLEISPPFPGAETQGNLRMQDLVVSYASRCEDKLFHFDQTLAFAGVTINGESYGPGGCEIEARNLDGEALGDFQNQVHALYRESFQSPDEIVARIAPLYSRLFVKLLDGTPELKVRRLYIATPKGEFDGNFLVKMAEHEGVTMAQPIALLQYLEAEARVVIQEGLLRHVMASNVKDKLFEARDAGQIPDFSTEEVLTLADQQADDQIQSLVGQKFLIRESGKFKANATFSRGKLELNGESLSIF